MAGALGFRRTLSSFSHVSSRDTAKTSNHTIIPTIMPTLGSKLKGIWLVSSMRRSLLMGRRFFSEHTIRPKFHAIIAFGAAVYKAGFAVGCFEIGQLMEVKPICRYRFKAHK